MELPLKLQAFLVSEQLAGKYQHGMIWLDGREKLMCRCGELLGRDTSDMTLHLKMLGLWDQYSYQWEAMIDWEG